MSEHRPVVDQEEALRLHRLLCERHPTASSDFCALVLSPLEQWLQKQFPRTDAHLVTDAVHRTIIDFIHNPHAYDPGRRRLFGYLCMAARGDLQNLLQSEARHCSRKIALEPVELDADDRNITSEKDDPALLAERKEERETLAAIVQSVRGDCDPRECAILDLMLADEHRTSAFAAVLAITDRPVEEQEREVKRIKGRIRKRLERRGKDHE